MDRFIETKMCHICFFNKNLKSNMDRFIDLKQKVKNNDI